MVNGYTSTMDILVLKRNSDCCLSMTQPMATKKIQASTYTFHCRE